MSLNPLRWADHGVGLALCLLQIFALAATDDAVGIPRDESFYFYAADRAGAWVGRLFDPEVRSFSRAEIDRGFKYNHEHPALMKLLFGVSHHLLVEKLGWVSDHRLGYRFPTMVMAGLAAWLAFLLGVMVQGRAAGVVAALTWMALPRGFFHGHLACFDAPVTFMWLAVAYTYLRAARSRRWALAAGVTLGLGLATKLNVFFAPFVLLLVAAVDLWQFKRRTGAWRAPAGERGPLTYSAWIAVSMVVLGSAVFWGHWPWLYYDTVDRVRAYVAFHARHVHYPVDYLGTLYYRPPFPIHFPFVFSALTIPVGSLVLMLIGAAVTVRRAGAEWRAHAAGRPPVEVFLLLNALFPVALIAAPSTPIFGGTKHWMPAMPFLCVMAGVGVVRLTEGLWPKAEGRGPLWRLALVAGLMLGPAVWATARYGSRGPVYFNSLAGGPPGAAELRMPRDFWGYSTIGVLPFLNESVEKGARVFWHNATRGAVNAYKRDGLLREDVRWTGDWTAPYSDWAVYHDQREKLPEEVDIWRAYGSDWPVGGDFVDGVQIMAVYHRAARPAAPPIPAGGR